MVLVSSPGGVIDSGSEAGFLTTECCQTLRLKPKNPDVASGLGGNIVKTIGSVAVKVSTLDGELITPKYSVTVVPKITNPLPSTPLTTKVRELLKNCPLGDDSFNVTGKIDFLIGIDLYGQIITGKPTQLGPSLPYVMPTPCGYVVFGTIPSPTKHSKVTLFTRTISLDEKIEKFWKTEEVNPPIPTIHPDDEFVETFYVKTTVQKPNKRYQVRLPFRPKAPLLGDSKHIAKRQFFNLERKFKNDLELKSMYTVYMADYLEKGFMKEVPEPLPGSQYYYLPHHGVVSMTSTSTKLRSVMNASQQTTNGVSLNQILFPGPKLQTEIPDMILNFRRFPIVFSGDIKQMYLQIDMHPDDQKFQLIFWRPQPDMELKTYALKTVCFGVASSPWLAIRTIKQLVKDHGHKHEKAAVILEKFLYMDDACYGGETVEQVIELMREINLLLAEGGFFMRKWTSNNQCVLSMQRLNDIELPTGNPEDPKHKILGVQWSPKKDVFSYKIGNVEEATTKRQILSQIASLFDVCGFVAPVIFKAKVFMQELWLLQLSWDTQLPKDLLTKWKTFVSGLHLLEQIEIPRHINTGGKSIEIMLSCDASEVGFSSLIHIRVPPEPTSPPTQNVFLVSSKTRVAPLKKVSLARLELCAAALAATHYTKCLPSLKAFFNIKKVIAWSDSTTALTWIQTPPYKLKTFVANRVTKIQEMEGNVIWRHLRSKDNPADYASRGLNPSEIKSCSLWWNGPLWWSLPEDQWPESIPTPSSQKVIPEVKKLVSVLTAQTESEPVVNPLPPSSKTNSPSSSENIPPSRIKNPEEQGKEGVFQFPQLSSWNKVLRSVAYVIRFLDRYSKRKPEERNSGPLKLSELMIAKNRILTIIQKEHFFREIENVSKGKLCIRSIQKLTPFLDKNGTLKVGGRLKNAPIPESARHQILLPAAHNVVRLIVKDFHLSHLHAAPQLLASLIAQHYWILPAKKLINSVVHSCVRCFKTKPKNEHPLMGDLPPNRVSPNAVFSSVTSDFAGPFRVKVHFTRYATLVDVYLCFFVCMSTKAIHIEVVHALSVPAFIAALHRFSARRGCPSHLYSDQGTNYIGSANYFKRILTTKNEEWTTYINQRQIQFHPLPPTGPWFNGLAEAAVKSAKSLIHRTVGTDVLTMEEFNTLAVRVEAILNSRPLTVASADPNDLRPLTAGDFLIGRPLVSPPEENLELEQVPIGRRWRLVDAMVQRIWKRWHLEYLQTLQRREKWLEKTELIELGTLVLIHEPNAPPLTWKLGKITEVFPGKDGQNRVAEVKTQFGSLRRPLAKLYPLPVNHL